MHRLMLWVALAASAAAAEAPLLERARELYNRTEYDAALKILASVAYKDSAFYLLRGQCYYMQGDARKASELFLKAVELEPANSDRRMWLGRAYGRRAETSSFFTAPGYATKARDNFEKAVQLNPRNMEAISDLFEYYMDAPGFLGGGLDKAAALARRIGELNPAEGHWAQARLAEKRKEYQKAEQQFRSAADLAPRQIGRVIDLAKFLAKAGRYQESEEAFRRAERIDPNAPKLLFERASIYIRTGRNLELARQLLKRYLEASLTPDDPPRERAEKLLKSASSS
ncbi:MAG: tetratricopeptide repeat protein [Bryobacteraceae bacterium]